MPITEYVEDFEGGAAGEAITPDNSLLTYVADMFFRDTPSLSGNCAGGVAGPFNGYGEAEFKVPGTWTSLEDVWADNPAYQGYFPVVADFVAYLIGTYGTEEAALAAMNAAGVSSPIRRFAARAFEQLNQDSSAGEGVIRALAVQGAAGGDFGIYLNTVAGEIRVTMGGTEPGGYAQYDVGTIPAEEWLEFSLTQDIANSTLVAAVHSAAGALLLSHDWAFDPEWYMHFTNIFTVNHDATDEPIQFIDNVEWSVGTEDLVLPDLIGALGASRRAFMPA